MFDFTRRINRATFLIGLILTMVGVLFVDITQALIEGANQDFFGNNNFVDFLQGIFILTGVAILFLYLLGITRQRANDVGWHPLLMTVLVFFNPLILVLAMLPGEKQKNKYGVKPKNGIKLK